MFQALGVTLASPVSAPDIVCGTVRSGQALLLEPERDTKRSGCPRQAGVPRWWACSSPGRGGDRLSCFLSILSKLCFRSWTACG